MGNINFSADMVGIQFLAQQGRSPIQDGEDIVMGSFEDMIMQLIANNITVLPEQSTEVVPTEEKEETQNVVIDAILNGMISPEIQIQTYPDENVQIDVPIVEVMAVQNNSVDFVLQPAVEKSTVVTVADVVLTHNDDGENMVFADVVQNIGNEEAVEVVDTINATVDNNIQVDAEFVQTNTETTKVEPKLFTKNHFQNNDNEVVENQKSFISTEDILMMRAGNKIDFLGERVVFKVADAPVNMEAPTAVTELADKILMKFTENEFEVELYPKHLGKISVSLVVEDGIVNVAMRSTNDKVNEFLASQSANIQNIVEKNTQYQAVVKLDNSQEQYHQQRDNAQHGADENQKNRQQEHLQQMYSQNMQHTTEDFLSMLRIV